jgi:hypothetical protein
LSEHLERAVGPDRRTFVKRLVVGTAFAAPVVASFTMSGVGAVFGGNTPSGVQNPNTSDPEVPTEVGGITATRPEAVTAQPEVTG